MVSAFHFGADAVYLSGKRFGMRAAADNFSSDELCRAVRFAHERNKKVYLTLNVMPRESELLDLDEYLKTTVKTASPDALIVADLGVFSRCRALVPEIPIHISTQAATVNSYSARQWYELGASRVVLARELSLSQISAIRAAVPDDLELEVFVHGSMCVSFSGRCMLSEYYTGRDANRGECTQPCRWQYRFAEEKRPDDVLTCEVQPEGSYIFGSKDLCMIEHVKELVDAGVSSFKIEGRMKSAYYAATTANAYRIALDAVLSGSAVPEHLLMKELESVSHREYCTGYYFDPDMQSSNLASTTGYQGEKTYLAVVEGFNPQSGRYICRQKNKFSPGDACEVLTPGQVGRKFQVKALYHESGEQIASCIHPQMIFEMECDQTLCVGDLIRKSLDL